MALTKLTIPAAQWMMQRIWLDSNVGSRFQKVAFAVACVTIFTAGIGGFLISVIRSGSLPSQAVAFSKEADDLRQHGKLKESLAQYQLAARLMPDPQLLARMGAVQSAIGLHEEAAESLQEAVRMSPRDPDLRAAWAKTLQDCGKAMDAENVFASALKLDPSSLKTRLMYAEMLQSLGRTADAGAMIREAVRHNPGSAAAQDALGNHLADQGLDAEAEQAFREAVRLDPKHAAALNNLGTILMARRNLTEAVPCFASASRLDPESFDYRWNLAHALRDSGDSEAALREFLVLQDRKPDPESARAIQSAIGQLNAAKSGAGHESK